MASKAVIIASLAGSAAAVEWRLAAEGQTCDQACKCLGCVEGAWPNLEIDLTNIGTKVGYECETVKTSTSLASPSYESGGVCHYSPSAFTGPTCSSIPRTGERRMCPCGYADKLTFHLGSGKSSCTEECLSFGATCVSSEVNQGAASVWPTSEEAFKGAFTNAGCTQYVASNSPLAPMKIGPMCYYAVNGANTNCDAFGTDYDEQRLCACQGVSSCVRSSATKHLQAWVPPPSTPAPSTSAAVVGNPPTVQPTTAAPPAPVAPAPSPASSDIACSNGWTTGGGSGGSKFKLTSTYHTADACKEQVEAVCDGAAAATYSPDIGECWCEKGQVTVDSDPTLVNCAFTSVVSLQGGRLYEVAPGAHQEPEKRGMSFAIMGAFAGALAMLAGLTYRSRGTVTTTPLSE